MSVEGWQKSEKTISHLIQKMCDYLLEHNARVDLRISYPYTEQQANHIQYIRQRQLLTQRPTLFNFKKKFKVIKSKNKSGIDGDRIIFPPSCSSLFRENMKPFVFEVSSRFGMCYGGSGYNYLEFHAPEGCIILPKWMYTSLYLRPDETVVVRMVKLQEGKFVKFRPQSKDFYEIKNHKETLEQVLLSFSTLAEGQLIPLR